MKIILNIKAGVDKMITVFVVGTVLTYSVLIGYVLKRVEASQ